MEAAWRLPITRPGTKSSACTTSPILRSGIDSDADVREAVEVVGRVLPFRTNRYVVDHLIDWSRVPEDPIFQLVFPQRQMLGLGQVR